MTSTPRPACSTSPAHARIAWLDGPETLVWREERLDRPRAGEILCETIVSAISPGTELAAWRGAPALRAGTPYPRVQGYCNVARVLETGDGVSAIAPGDRVLTLQSHRSHFVCKATQAYAVLDAGMDCGQIATSYLFQLGYNAVLRSGARAGNRVAVIGLGVLGLTSLAMAALAGAELYAISDHPSAHAIARKAYGARRAFTRGEIAAGADEIVERADIVILTTNGWEDFRLALALAGPNAVIACLGFPGREQAPGGYNPLAADPFYTRQLRIEAVGLAPLENDPRGFARFNLRDNLAFIMRSLAEGRLDAQPILSGRYPARQIERAYADLAARKDDAITYLLDWAA